MCDIITAARHLDMELMLHTTCRLVWTESRCATFHWRITASHCCEWKWAVHSKNDGVLSTPKMVCHACPNTHTILGGYVTPKLGVFNTLIAVCTAHLNGVPAHSYGVPAHSYGVLAHLLPTGTPILVCKAHLYRCTDSIHPTYWHTYIFQWLVHFYLVR